MQRWSAGEWVNGDVDDVPDLLGEAHEEVPVGFVCLHHHLVHDRVRDGLGDDRVLSTNCFCYFAVAHHRVAHCLLTVEEPMACVVRTHDAELSPRVLELDLECFYLTEEDGLAGSVISGHGAHFHEVANFQPTLHRDRQIRIGELDFTRRRQIYLGLDLDATYPIRNSGRIGMLSTKTLRIRSDVLMM